MYIKYNFLRKKKKTQTNIPIEPVIPDVRNEPLAMLTEHMSSQNQPTHNTHRQPSSFGHNWSR